MQRNPTSTPFFPLVIGSIGALGLWLGLANPLIHIPLLIFLYPACLAFLGMNAPSISSALRWGWLTSLSGSSACLYWIAVPVHEVGQLPLPLAVPCVVALGAYIGVYGGIFAVLAYMTRPLDRTGVTVIETQTSPNTRLSPVRNVSPGARALILGLGWFLLEWLRGWLFSGFPWLSLAGAFAPWPVLLQGLSVVGAYGLAGLFAGLACLAGVGASSRNRIIALALLLALCAFGLWRMQNPVPASGEPVSLALVQGNMNQNEKWEPAVQQATIERYLRLSDTALTAQPDLRLIIWPETSMPFDFQRHQTFSRLVRDFAVRRNTSLLLGSVGREQLSVSERALYNRAYLVNRDTDSLWYEKEHLVPFGEYLPAWLNLPFLQSLLQGVGNFTPGRLVLPLSLLPPKNYANSTGKTTFSQKEPEKELVLGVLICYETIFPELARERVAQGAQLLVNISNDAWFGQTAAPVQHLYLTLLRAVEQGRYLARATNTGLTAFIDPYGRIRRQGGLFETLVLTDAVPPVLEKTIFFHVAPWLPAGASLLFIWLLFPLRHRFFKFLKN